MIACREKEGIMGIGDKEGNFSGCTLYRSGFRIMQILHVIRQNF